MRYKDVPNLLHLLAEWSEDLAIVRQQSLLDESQFLTFAKDRGLPVFGIITGDPGRFHRRGWLHADAVDSEGKPKFHPFRLFPMHHILRACDLNVTPSASLNAAPALALLQSQLRRVPSTERFGEHSNDWNNIANLAVLLEPIHWPRIVGSRRCSAGMSADEYQNRLTAYGDKVIDLVRSLDPGFWQRVHEYLRLDAAEMDQNGELYVLLRVASWDERRRVRSQVSGALWIRHMAEVIRRAFEEVHEQCWPEEDTTLGNWYAGARKLYYGSERPFDDVLAAKPYVAKAMGLFTGSTVRWYVEGDTEFFSVLEIFPAISRFGVELVNLRGEIASGKGNVPLKLETFLKDDRSMRRFSALSFDGDVSENVRYVRRQAALGNVVGAITIHDPDYEFANFDLAELIEIAATLDESAGFPGDPVRQADWSGINNARSFEARYRKSSARNAPGLKGEGWGRALARYAKEHHTRPDGKHRPLWQELWAAVHAWIWDYEFQLSTFTFHPQTLELVRKTT